MIGPVIKLIRVLQSNTHPREIAAGGVLALFFGLTPLNHTHVIFLVLAFFLFRINRAATVLLLPVVKLFFYLGLAEAADAAGYTLLARWEFLAPFWGFLTNAPVLTYLDFNYTLVLGGCVLAAVLSAPVYFLIIRAVNVYRGSLGQRLNEWKITRWIKGLTISKWITSWWPKN